jgi:hypothetical protein
MDSLSFRTFAAYFSKDEWEKFKLVDFCIALFYLGQFIYINEI